MGRLGVLIDLAHADSATTFSDCELTLVPVVNSHTGASAVREFPTLYRRR
ncbi:membrane dipeptidase [Mycobacteroides chelonae]|nr:membrane dipeptidase [Mycobacteroides chelonae]